MNTLERPGRPKNFVGTVQRIILGRKAAVPITGPGGAVGMSAVPNGFESESDEDLVVMMGWDDDPETSRAAFGGFYTRHARFVYVCLCKAFLRKGMNDKDVEDLVTDTFLRAKDRATTFQRCDGDDEGQRRRHIRAWLMAIASNLARDLLRGRKKLHEQPVALDTLLAFTGTKAATSSDRLKLVEFAFNDLLTHREREVLRVTMEFYDPARENQRLPDDVAADLAARLNTTSDNLRKIRKRALEKIRDYVEAALSASVAAR
jgi:RNA polymerase sigma factor (sigma-70 family)